MRLRWLGAAALVVLALGGVFVGQGSTTAGPGGWDHVGDAGTPGTASLDGNVNALNTDAPGELLVGGTFFNAGGNALAAKIASWNGTNWTPIGRAGQQLTGGDVFAIAYANDKIYAGGSFQNAGGDPNADNLAVWDGSTWAPGCDAASGAPAITGNVKALQIIGSTIYVGGEFPNGAGLGSSADYLVACDLSTGAASATLPANMVFSGPVYALTADSNGVLYAGGGFTNLADIPAADNVAYLTGNTWHAMGAGSGQCTCAVDDFVRSLTAVGTDVYVGTDAKDVAGLPKADNVVRWNGAWSALGSNAADTDGWFPTATSINALTSFESKIYATGLFLNADGDLTADHVAVFDGSSWDAVGSNGSGNGPWSGAGNALAIFEQGVSGGSGMGLYAGGGFIGAGGDATARGIAVYTVKLTPVNTPTPTPTPSAAPVPTPVATPTPGPAPTPTPTPTPDVTPPRITSLRLSSTTFRAATSGAPFRAASVRVGTIVSFTLSEPGTVRFTIDRSTAGRTVNRRCVKPKSANRARPRCKRWVAEKGSFVVTGKSGVNRIELRGRIGGRTLRPGSYRLNARETDRASNRSSTKRTAFRIVR